MNLMSSDDYNFAFLTIFAVSAPASAIGTI
jgi:hypothetical protein